jgi:hypothetical protein
MPDEIATEKRARYDDRTNKVAGICRQHGWKLPLDLRAGDDLNVFCKEVKDGNGHLAGEVCSFFSHDMSCHLHTPCVKLRPPLPLWERSCKLENGAEHAAIDNCDQEQVETKEHTALFVSRPMVKPGAGRRLSWSS